MERTSPSGDTNADQSKLFQNFTESLARSGSHDSHRKFRFGSIIVFFLVISWMVLFSTMLGLSRPGNVRSSSASVTTYHNDNSRSGANVAETILTPFNVNAGQFGKLFSYSVDGDVYAQPLYLPNVRVVGKGVHNVVYIATENDSVYAFDADSNAGANSSPLWHASFINPGAGITPVSNLDVSCNDISPKVGITGTPVIDPGSGTLYVVAKTKENGSFVQRLHALDVTSGAEKFGGPVVIQAQVRGTGQGAKGGMVSFDPLGANQWPGLLLQNGLVYVAWASHCDNVLYHGWVIAFNATTLATTGVWNATPNGQAGGIWQSGGAPAADSAGNVYFATGNGDFTANTAGLDFGDSILKLSSPSNGTIAVGDYFHPLDEAGLNAADNDLGSGGVLLLPAQPSGSPHQHLLIQSGKEGTIYLIDRDNIGKFNGTNNSQIVQSLPGALGPVLSTPGWWNNTVYFAAKTDVLKAYSFNSSTGLLASVPSSESITFFNPPGATPSISANGSTNAVVWVVQTDQFQSGSPAVLHAYDATNLTKLYDSSQNPNRDNPGPAVISVVPTVVNGKVYVGARSQLSVYGLLGNHSLKTGAAQAAAAMDLPVNNEGVPSIASFDQVTTSTGGGGSIGFVQVNDAIVHPTKVSVTYGSAQTAGNLNVVAVGWNDAVSSVSSVTDTKGNIYSLAVGPTRGTALSQAIYYAKNIAAAAAGANTVVVKFNQSPTVPDVRILEYSGLSTSSPLDVTAGTHGSGLSSNSGSATTTVANELIFGANMVSTSTAGPGSTFTSRIITAAGDIAEDSIVSTTGSYSASAPLSQYGNWVMQMATFKAASAGSIGFAQVNDLIDHLTSVSLAYGSAQTAGNLNVVAVGWNDAVSNVSSVTDTKGNIYSLAVGPTRGTALSQAIYYAKNIAAAAAGANTVVVKFNQTPTVPDIRILEYSGLSTTSPLDVTAGAFGNSSSSSSGSATTTAANELIFGANTVFTGTTGPGSSFTSRIITASGDIAEDRIVSTTGSYSASAPLSSSGNWVMQMATFESTGAPTVLSVSPSSGSDNGGTSVTITGTNFVSGAAATFGGTDASNVTVVSSTSMTATTRANTAGAVTVLVTNPNGQSGSLTNGYTYTANPMITSVSPSSGSVSGGTSVTITGTNFASGATVTFGGTAATKVTFVSGTSITATTPAHAAGGVNVVVTNSNGLSGMLTNGFIYNATASTIKFVQVAAATPQTPMSAVSVTYPSAQTAGNLNVVVVGWNDATSSVKSVTDSHGNTYTLAVGPVLGTNLSQSIYYLKNIASGSNTVTATFNQSAVSVDLRVLEYSGADPQNPLDATASAAGNSSTTSSGSAPTNAANELVVAANTVYTGNSGPGSGFTKRIITSPDGDLVEDEIVSTAGTYGATAPLGSSGPWVMQMVTFTPVQLPATGPLKVSANPLYFADGSGHSIYLTGAHTWPNNKDGWGIPGGTCPPPQFNWTGYLNYVQSYRYNSIRLWTWELPTSLSEPDPKWYTGNGSTECHLPFAFLRAGPGYATDGQPKFDLTQFNQAFFDRLRQRVIEAGQAGVYVSIMLFDGFGLVSDRVANDGYWFTGANNINAIDDGYTKGISGYNSQTGSNPAITQIQDAYVKKVIDTVNDLPNVLYEIANEANPNSTSWQEGMITLIQSYEATKPYQHPVGFTCNDDNSYPYWSSKADYVAPCGTDVEFGSYSYPVSETSTGNKVVIDDSDHSWPWKNIQTATKSDPAAMRKWVWENFTRGANTAFMDPYLIVWPQPDNYTGGGRNCPADGESSGICGAVIDNQATTTDPYWNTIRTALSQTATYARQIDLAHMTPQNTLCETNPPLPGYCLVSSGQQYLVYSPAGGAFTVTLLPGTYNYQWFNPATNAVAATGTIKVTGAHTFVTPFSGDAVLLLKVN